MELVLSDFSGLEGSCCYCSGEAGAEMRKRISALPLEAVHYIGTGDYHYQTLFWLERIGRPFALLLIDNHPDDQPGAFGHVAGGRPAALSVHRHRRAFPEICAHRLGPGGHEPEGADDDTLRTPFTPRRPRNHRRRHLRRHHAGERRLRSGHGDQPQDRPGRRVRTGHTGRHCFGDFPKNC